MLSECEPGCGCMDAGASSGDDMHVDMAEDLFGSNPSSDEDEDKD